MYTHSFLLQGKAYVLATLEVDVSIDRIELGAYVCSKGFLPVYLEEDFLTGAQGGYDDQHGGGMRLL